MWQVKCWLQGCESVCMCIYETLNHRASEDAWGCEVGLSVLMDHTTSVSQNGGPLFLSTYLDFLHAFCCTLPVLPKKHYRVFFLHKNRTNFIMCTSVFHDGYWVRVCSSSSRLLRDIQTFAICYKCIVGMAVHHMGVSCILSVFL